MNFKFIIKNLFNQLGYEVRKLPKMLPEQKKSRYEVNAYSEQKSLLGNQEVKVIFDLGANQGQTIREYRRWFPHATIYSFEPFEEVFTVLHENYKNLDSVKLYKQAVTDTVGIKQFFSNKENTTNSLLPMTADSGKYVESQATKNIKCINVETITVDNFCQKENIHKIHILKMDIQGEELRALQGSINLLRQQSIDLVYTEVLFANLYEGQASFYSLCEFLEQYGYILYGLYSLHYSKKGVLVWGDAIFISPSIEESLKEEENMTIATLFRTPL